jgi:ubiquinone/menaquinone biosynthesis C-methylase UbiE
MPYRWLADNRMPVEGQSELEIPQVVTHDFGELPFATQSLDLVVLPHVLEFAAEPHQVLREVERVLIPEGQVIICGFNPSSLWGMRQVAGRLTGALPAAGW